MRYLFPFIIIVACVTVFLTVVRPRYNALVATRQSVSVSTSSLDIADKISKSREELIAKYNSISKNDLDNLKILLPDSVDNIRLIIQVNSLATKNGLTLLKNVNYESEKVASPDSANIPYGEFNITFQTSGTYKNFLRFISDLEQNLRLVDITNVSFSNDQQTQVNSLSYKVTLKTYWLKK